MNWPVVAVLAYLVLGLELGVSPQLQLGTSGVAPSFVVPFVVFLSLFAPPVAAMWVAVTLGLVIDLASPRGASAIPVAGPYALGYLAASYFTLQVRGLVIRKNPLTLVLLSAVAAALSGILIVGLLSVRAGLFGEPEMWRGAAELGRRLLSAGYTAASAGILALLLFPMFGVFRFYDPHMRRQTTKRF